MSLNQRFFKPIHFFLVLILSVSSSLYAQELNLTQFYSSSESHNSLLVSSTDRLDSLYSSYLREHNIQEDNGSYQEFIYDYNFFLEKLNKSGKVFSGDELTKYLNSLKDEILVNHPKKNSIVVYTTNFDQLNAFTNDFGSIYVNVATIAKIDSEMKLRVILAHEIAHVLMRHSFKMANLDNHFSNDKFERINQISDFDTHQFSQKQELEADSIAYSLLSDLGYDLSDLEDLFENLNTSRNPVFPDSVYINNLSLSSNGVQLDYLNRIGSIVQNQNLTSKIEEDDSLSTHPSADARKLLYKKIWLESADSTLNRSSEKNENFQHFRLLAAHVLARTLMTEHKYIEGLYLVIQLREKYPEDVGLIKLFLKLQLLITQSKYMFSESSIVNDYGNSCTDQNYLAFRKAVLCIPALEMNIICATNIKEAQSITNHTYLNRLSDFSNQFLYKFNPKIIAKNGGELVLTDKNIEAFDFLKRPLLNFEQKQRYKEIRKEGYILVDTVFRNKPLIHDFLSKFDQYDEFKKSLHTYRDSRDQFEKMLTIDKFIVDFNPDESYRKFRKGETNNVREIPDSAITALVQTDTYVYTRQADDDIIMDSKKTLEVHKLINDVLQSGNFVSKDLTNLNQSSSEISIRDNHMHYLLTNWIGECLNFEDLVYSVADEEILNYLKSENTEYLVYNFNILNKSKSNSKYRCLYYNLYFDIENMGVAYVSIIASGKKPKKKYLRHYFYQAHFGKSKL